MNDTYPRIDFDKWLASFGTFRRCQCGGWRDEEEEKHTSVCDFQLWLDLLFDLGGES